MSAVPEGERSRPEHPPSEVPLFPLTGVILLPGGRLPLHVFEERYCNMVDDVLADHGCIGIVQPKVPTPDDLRGELPGDVSPDLYPVGCLGWIEYRERLPYERHLVLLRGWSRFVIREELSLHRGYRRARIDVAPYEVDRREDRADVEAAGLLDALRRFGRDHRVEIEIDELHSIAGLDLLNSIAMALPFQPAEKQALLEAGDVRARHEMLLALLEMGVDLEDDTQIAN